MSYMEKLLEVKNESAAQLSEGAAGFSGAAAA